MADRNRAGSKQVFLSYDRERTVEAFVVKLKQDLEKEELTVFLDVRDIPPGSNWVDTIGRGLDNSKCLVAVISSGYLTSSYASSELHVADSNSKPIFPVIFEDVDFEKSERSLEVKYVISGLSWFFFRPEVDNYVSSLARLRQGMARYGIGPNAPKDNNSLASGMSRLFISPGRVRPPSTPEMNLTTSNCGSSNPDEPTTACDPPSSSHPSYPQQPVTPPRGPQAPPTTTPQQQLLTMTPNPGSSPTQPEVSQDGPIQPHTTPPRLPYHPGFSPQYPFPGYVPPPGYQVPYTTDSINPVPPNREEIDQQDQEKKPVPSSHKVLPKDRFRVGMKLEALDRRFPYYVCVATIEEAKDNGQVLIHFDGWGEEYDYWCDADDIELHPVGWCSQHKYELYPARGANWRGWNKYLMDKQAEGADSSYFNEVQLAPPGSLLFRPGMRLEAKDPSNPEQVRVATIKKVADDKLLIHFDSYDDKKDYWCAPDSLDIHPAMWSGKHGKKVEKPKGHGGNFKWSQYLAKPDINPAPAHCFTKAQLGFMQEEGGLFEVGMKLEAKDRKHPNLVCVATITGIQGNKLLIHFDGWTKYYDYWCEPDTADIHPVGWCEDCGHELQIPNGHVGPFSWDSYLFQSGASPAPPDAFTDAQRQRS